MMQGIPLGLHKAPEYSGPLPKEADAVIIGGGVIGVCAAYYLAQLGLKPLLLEKGRVAAEQSARNWGWIRKTGRDYAELPIVIEAQERWEELAAVCKDDFGLKRPGVTFLPKNEAQLGKYEAWAKEFGRAAGTQMLSRAQVAALLPDAQNPWGGAMHTPDDMVAEPFEAVPALARAAVAAGVSIREGCAVRGLLREAGAVSGVVTEAGDLKTKLVLVAAGAWSSLFLRREGVSIPQLSVRSNVLATEAMPSFFEGAAGEDAMSFRRRKDGGYTMASLGVNHLWVGPDALRHVPHYRQLIVGGDFGMSYRPPAPRDWPDGFLTKRRWRLDEETPFERMRVLDPAPSDAALDRMLDKFAARFPKIGRPKVARRWAGMIDTMPDVVPIVDHAPVQGLSICTGMCGHGFGIGPAFGRIMADMMLGRDVGHDLTRFRLARFDNYAKLELGPDV